MDYMERFYAILPCARLPMDAGRYIHPDVMRKRAALRGSLSLPGETYGEEWVPENGMEYSYHLTKNLILHFGALIERNQFHEAFTPLGPAPLLRLIIASKKTNERAIHGKSFPSQGRKDVVLTPSQSLDRVVPRMLRHSLTPTKREVLSTSKSANWVYNILANEDVCLVDDSGDFQEDKEDNLLTESRLGWSSVGRDSLNLQIWPDFSACEKELLRLVNLPINAIRQVPQVTAFGSSSAKVSSFAEELHSAALRLQDLLQFSLYGPLALLAVLRQYEYLSESKHSTILTTLINAHISDYAGLGKEMRKIKADMQVVTGKFPNELQFGLLEVDLRPLKADIQRKGSFLLSCLLKELTMEYIGLLNHSKSLFKRIKSDLFRVPKTVEEFHIVSHYLETKQDETNFAQIRDTLSQTDTISGVLNEFQHVLSPEQEQKYWETKTWAAELMYLRSKMMNKLAILRPGFIDQVEADTNALHELEIETKTTISQFETYADIGKADEYAAIAAKIATSLHESITHASLINSREATLHMKLTDFSVFTAMKVDFQPFQDLWSFASLWTSAWNEWNYRSFHTVDSDSVQTKFNNGVKLLEKLAAELADHPSPLQVARTMQEQTQQFQQYVQIIIALRQPAIHERHMERLLEMLHLEANTETVTLLDLASAGVLGETQVIEQICHDARNEYEIEMVLQTTEREVGSFDLSLETDRDFPGLRYLTGLRKAEETVQELQVTLSFLTSSSKYVAYFRQKIEKLAVSLTISLQVIRDIAEFQEQWLRIYPLLQLPDIFLSLKDNSELIDDLQAFFSRQMHVVHSTQSLTVTSDAKIKSFVEAIERCEFLWKVIKKAVIEKTETFPRLLFLSRKEIVQLLGSLARGRDVRISALFPGIEPLNLPTSQLKEVYHGSSLLALRPEVQLADFSTRARTELWLQDLEKSLHISFQTQLAALVSQDSLDWWKSCDDLQVLLIAEQIIFSRLVSERAVVSSITRLKELLNGLIAEICPLCGTTDKKTLVMFKKPGVAEAKMRARKNLEKLVLQVLNQLNFLHTAQVHHSDFMWKAWFHFSAQQNCEVITVAYFDFTQHFGFEWAQLPLPLLVQTPTTERCMLNLAITLKNSSCGLLQGPVASNKTETIKEMALMYGKLVLFWTVSSSANPTAVLQALSAGVSTGAWVCFEEIHLLDAVHLNSLAYYLIKIRDLATGFKAKVDIDGRNVTIVPGFALWSTSTSAKLAFPACLSDCFRTLSVSKPDIAIILEIRLYALGFTSASDISHKLACALELWQEDCSALTHIASPTHYRLPGLRVANMVIDAITQMLDAHVFSDINYLLQNACRRVLSIGLQQQELVELDEFLTTVFHSACNDTVLGVQSQVEFQQFQSALRERGLCEGEEVMRKLRHIRLCLSDYTDRKVVVVAGPVGVGKTALVKIAIEVQTKLAETAFNVPVLSGQVSSKLMHQLIQACAGSVPTSSFPHLSLHPQEQFSPNDIIVIDADISLWDGLLAVARNDIYLQKELRVEIPKGLKVVAETEKLEEVSPGLLAEAVLLYFDENIVSDEDFFSSSLFYPCPTLIADALKELFTAHFASMFAVFGLCKPAVPIPRRTAISSLCNWLALLLGPPTLTVPRLTSLKLESKQKSSSYTVQRAEAMNRTEVEAAWVIAVVGSMGMLVEDRDRFGQEIRGMCADEKFAAGLITVSEMTRNEGIFEINYSFTQREWLNWEQFSFCHNPTLIPTISVLRLQHWSKQALLMHKHSIIIGPHQSGKSLVLSSILRDCVSQDFASVIPLHILPTTSYDSIQYEVERMMDQYRPRHFGALGGRHHYIFLEDMNQDSGQIYDLLRFVSGYGGWYKRDIYSTINDITFCLAHSYSSHKFRSPNYRTLRHFLVLYKEEYAKNEIIQLFSVLNADLGERFATVYEGLRSAVVGLEGTWYHSTLSNFISALHWSKYCANWSAIIARYFPFLSAKEDSEAGFFVPKIMLDVSQNDPYTPLSSSNFPLFSSHFEELIKKCESKNAEISIISHKSGLSCQIYHLTQVVSDLQHQQHSIIATKRDLQPLQAAVQLAAELLQLKLVEIVLFNATSELANSMAEREGHYLPTEVKFAIKQMVDSALKGEKSVCLVRIDDQSNINSPIFRSFMEVCCDIVMGTSLKAYSITRKAHKQYHDLYPDQVLQLQRDLVQANIVFSFLIRSQMEPFDRSQPFGPIETLKHVYRTLFNKCRITVYEDQLVPNDLISLTHSAYLIDNQDASLYDSLSYAVNLTELDDFTKERIAYIAKAMQQREEGEINSELSVLTKALLRLRQVEQELERPESLLELQNSIEILRKNLQNARREVEENAKMQVVQPANLPALIEAEREEYMEICEAKKKRVTSAITTFIDTVELMLERPSLYQLILLGGIQRLVCPSEEGFPFEDPGQYLSHCQPVLHRLRTRLKEVSRKLQNIDLVSIPDLTQHLLEVQGSPGSQGPLHSLVVALVEGREVCRALEEKVKVWNEGKLTKSTEDKSQKVKMETGKALVESLQKSLEETEERLQSALLLKQKYLRFLHELKPALKEWTERAAQLTSQLQFPRGNALLRASLFVLGLSLEKSLRISLKSRIKEILEEKGFKCAISAHNKQKGAELTPFLRQAVKACEWIWELGLPYPVFIDSVGIAANLIAAEKDLAVIWYSTDVRVDSSLETCIEKGRSVLVMVPAEGMMQMLMPLFRWRSARSIQLAQGMELSNLSISLGRKRLKVHPNFRLYVSLPMPPADLVAKISTVISLQAADGEAWKSAMMLKLERKTLKGETTPSTVHNDVAHVRTLKAFADCQIESIYTGSNLQGVMRVWQSDNLLKPIPTLKSTLPPSSSLHNVYLPLLAAACDLQTLLQKLKLGKWTVPQPVFQRMLLLAAEEQMKLVGPPSDSQVLLYQDPMLYRFLVRLLWALPSKLQSALLISYSIHKASDSTRAAQTIDLMQEGLLLPFTTNEAEIRQRVVVLQSKWEYYPENMQPDSKELRRFLNRDLYIDAGLSDAVDPCTQAVLVAWLRPDLISTFGKALVTLVIGRRFATIPYPDLGLVADLSISTVPIALFYYQRDPLTALRQSAALAGASVTHLIPLASKNTRFISESRLQAAIKALSQACHRKEWLVLEGFEALEKAQIELLFLQMMEILHGEEIFDHFRLWFIFPKTSKLKADWSLMLENCIRICYPEPVTIHDKLVLSLQVPTKDSPAPSRLQYAKHSQLSIPLSRKKSRKVNRTPTNLKLIPALQRSFRSETMAYSTSTPTVQGISGADGLPSEQTLGMFYRFNVSLVTAAIEMRQRFDKEMEIDMSQKETEQNWKTIFSMFEVGKNESWEEVGKQLILTYFQLIGLRWSQSAFYTALNICKHAIWSRLPMLKFNTSVTPGDWCFIQYPLYQLAAPAPYQQLLIEMPREDHFHLIGLPHVLYRKYWHRKAAKVGKAMAGLRLQKPAESGNIVNILQEYRDKLKLMCETVSVDYGGKLIISDMYEKISKEKAKGFSYFFMPDRYRAADYQMKVFSQPPSISQVLPTLNKSNTLAFSLFARKIYQQCDRLVGFLQYRTTQISPKDRKTISKLRRQRVPTKWRQQGPYSLRSESTAAQYISKLFPPLLCKEGVIHMREVMNPVAFLATLIRALTLTAQLDIGKIHVELAEYDGKLSDTHALLDGFMIYNAALKGHFLQDTEHNEPWKLPVCSCSVIPASSEDLSSSGIFFHYRSTANERVVRTVEREDSIQQMVNAAFNYPHTSWIDKGDASKAKSTNPFNRIMCPMFPFLPSSACFNVVFYSEKPQSHWTKRGIRLDLI